MCPAGRYRKYGLIVLNPFHVFKLCIILTLLIFCWSRASDKKRNLAQQKAEAQRRLYGHGSMKKLSAASSDWEKQRHTLERRREELVMHKQINVINYYIGFIYFERICWTRFCFAFTLLHIFPSGICQLKPQFSLLATDQLRRSVWDAKHLHEVVLLDCGQGSWEWYSFISPPRLLNPAGGLKQWLYNHGPRS